MTRVLRYITTIDTVYLLAWIITMTDTEKSRRRGRPRAFDEDEALGRAMDAFRSSGFDGASIPLLTQAMGISAQSLYAAFGSKEALYRAAVEHYRETVGAFAAHALAEEPDALDAVARMLREAATVFSASAATAGCMMTMAPAGASGEPLAPFGRQLRAESAERVAERLARGVGDGQVDAAADGVAWARYVTSVMQGMAVQARDGASASDLLSIAGIAARSLRQLRVVESDATVRPTPGSGR